MSAEEFRRQTEENFDEKVESLRTAVKKAYEEGRRGTEPTFSATVPDGLNSFMIDVVVREWEADGFTVTKMSNRLNFQA
jgi:hypothetical protein